RVPVGARHKVLSESGLPIARDRHSIGDGFEVVLARYIAPDKDRKIVRKSKRRTQCEVELLLILSLCFIVDHSRVGLRRFVQYRCVRGSGVFGIDVDLARQQAFVRQIAAKLELAHDLYSLFLQHLREDLSEDDGFGEVFRADNDPWPLGKW